MSPRLLLPTLVVALCAVAPATARTQPNVIVLITDDQGWPELSAHGNPVLKTPHLDAVRAASVRLTDFHVAPMCTPTRGQLLTGLDAARHGAINVSSGRTLLRRGVPTMADFFQEAGYGTGLFGKWHLGDNFPFRPQDRGFSEAVWFPSSHINSVPDHWDNDYFDDTYLHRGDRRRYEGYCTDVFFDAAIDWMRAQSAAAKPFFAYLATNAPHSPHWVPEEHRLSMEESFARAEAEGKVPSLPRGKREQLVRYLAMIEHLDGAVGRLDEFLKASGLFENTLLVFLTDNGSTFAEDYYPAGMRGRKTQLWEGGHRVPCFLRWPGGPLGKPRDHAGLTQAQDLLPTVLRLCGIPAAETSGFDGVDLVPQLTGEAAPDPERMLVINYSRMPHGFDYPAPDAPSRMTREGAAVLWKRWRLLEDRELYDLGSDPLQQHNVIADHPAITSAMHGISRPGGIASEKRQTSRNDSSSVTKRKIPPASPRANGSTFLSINNARSVGRTGRTDGGRSISRKRASITSNSDGGRKNRACAFATASRPPLSPTAFSPKGHPSTSTRRESASPVRNRPGK